MNQDNDLNNATQKAPACFGAISCFAKDSEHCKLCVAYEQCEKQSFATLQSIKNIVNVDDLMRKHLKARQETEEKRKNAIEEAKKAQKDYSQQPKMPTAVERATKVEKIVFEVTEQDQSIVMTLPVKAQFFAITLIKSGIMSEIKNGVKTNTNALKDKKPAWMSKSIDLLINGGFTRSELKNHLMKELSWSDNSAGAHVSLAIAILCGFSVAQEKSDRIVTAP